jgi:hypothetical protein
MRSSGLPVIQPTANFSNVSNALISQTFIKRGTNLPTRKPLRGTAMTDDDTPVTNGEIFLHRLIVVDLLRMGKSDAKYEDLSDDDLVDQIHPSVRDFIIS